MDFGTYLMNKMKDKLCVVLLNNFKPRFAPRVKNETEQAYHKIYLVYA